MPKSPKYIELVKKLEKLLSEDLKLPGTKLEFAPAKLFVKGANRLIFSENLRMLLTWPITLHELIYSALDKY